MIYTTDQKTSIDQDNRQMALAGIPMSGELQALQNLVNASSIGATAAGYDIDSVALGGGCFAINADTTTGLTLGLRGGRIRAGQSIVTVAAGTLALSASNTNYVECDAAGTVSKNTVGFTGGRVPLYVVTTGVGTISVIASAKVFLMALANASISSAILTADAATKSLDKELGSVAATTKAIWRAPCAGTVTAISLVEAAVVAADDTNYWTFDVTNKGNVDGSGTAKIVNGATAANSTKATGGSALAAYVGRSLTLNGTPTVAAGDVLEITLTKAASATTMTEVDLRIDILPVT